jgi:hypothetical protein
VRNGEPGPVEPDIGKRGHAMDTDEALEQIRKDCEKEFRKAMVDQCEAMRREINHNPTRVRHWIAEYGPYEAATKTIKIPGSSTGYMKLLEAGRLDLSIEALVLDKYPHLFPPGIVEECKKILGRDRWADVESINRSKGDVNDGDHKL